MSAQHGQIFETAEIAPGVTRTTSRFHVQYAGKRDALLAAGVAKPGWFADGNERDKRGRVVGKNGLSMMDGAFEPSSGRVVSLRFISTKLSARNILSSGTTGCFVDPSTKLNLAGA